MNSSKGSLWWGQGQCDLATTSLLMLWHPRVQHQHCPCDPQTPLGKEENKSFSLSPAWAGCEAALELRDHSHNQLGTSGGKTSLSQGDDDTTCWSFCQSYREKNEVSWWCSDPQSSSGLQGLPSPSGAGSQCWRCSDPQKSLGPAWLWQCSQELRCSGAVPCGTCPTEPTLVLCPGRGFVLSSGPGTDGGRLFCFWTSREQNTICVSLPNSPLSVKLLLDFICFSHPSASYFLLQPSSFSKQLQWCHYSFKSKPWLFQQSCSSGNSCNCFLLTERWFNACFHNQYKWKPHYTAKLWQVSNYLDCYFKDLPW